MRTMPEMFQSSPGQRPEPIQPLAMPASDHHPEPTAVSENEPPHKARARTTARGQFRPGA